MSIAALGLVLVAALLHACWNVVAKRTGGDARFALIAAVFLVGLWAPLGIWAGSGDRVLRFVGAACIGCGVAGLALG